MHYSHNKENYEKLWEKIKDIRAAMMTTIDNHNCLRSRPMYTEQTEFDGTIWFFSKDNTAKIHELKNNFHVNLSYADIDNNTFVSISGNAEISFDKEKINELWDPALNIWFNEGKNDPHLCLIKIEVDQAEYWDTKAGTMIYMIGKAMSNLTGEELQTSEHEKINIEK